MKITNNLNLPEPLVKAVTLRGNRGLESDAISVTQLIQPPQIRGLKVKYDGELSEDASDRIFALLGQLMAEALERNAGPLDGHIAEEKLELRVLGWKITGRYDLSSAVLDGEVLTDYKLTSIWALKDGVKREFEQQLNLYKYLIESTTKRVISALEIVAVYRDWSRIRSQYSKDYPQTQVKKFMVPIWGAQETRDFLEDRIRLHQEAAKGSWPECSDEERWLRGEKWAVMKKGRKRALKLHNTESSALTHARAAKELYVEYRPGANLRCENYCPVSEVCPQWQKIRPAFPLGNLEDVE